MPRECVHEQGMGTRRRRGSDTRWQGASKHPFTGGRLVAGQEVRTSSQTSDPRACVQHPRFWNAVCVSGGDEPYPRNGQTSLIPSLTLIRNQTGLSPELHFPGAGKA